MKTLEKLIPKLNLVQNQNRGGLSITGIGEWFHQNTSVINWLEEYCDKLSQDFAEQGISTNTKIVVKRFEEINPTQNNDNVVVMTLYDFGRFRSSRRLTTSEYSNPLQDPNLADPITDRVWKADSLVEVGLLAERRHLSGESTRQEQFSTTLVVNCYGHYDKDLIARVFPGRPFIYRPFKTDDGIKYTQFLLNINPEDQKAISADMAKILDLAKRGVLNIFSDNKELLLTAQSQILELESKPKLLEPAA